MFAKEGLLIIISIAIVAHAQDENSIDDSATEDDKKRELLRWFPADSDEDCKEQPGAEQVREGKPSKSCREDEERFCFCGRIGEPTVESNSWKFLCGTCKISFKLDRKKIDPSKDNRLKARNVRPSRPKVIV